MRLGLSLMFVWGTVAMLVRGQQSTPEVPVESEESPSESPVSSPVPSPAARPASPVASPAAAVANSTEAGGPGDALMRLQNVQSIDDFLALMQDANGNNVTRDTLFSDENAAEGKLTIRGGGRMATPDTCSPRNMTVKLELPGALRNAILYPKCTQIERCGGCVSQPHLKCEPAYTERVSLQVLRARQSYPGSPYLQWVGFEQVLVHRHVRCHVTCSLSQDKCGPLKDFQQAACTCVCKNAYRNQVCQPPKHFNPETCQCECSNANEQCCQTAADCRLVFDHNRCQCVVRSSRWNMASSTNITAHQFAAYTNQTRQLAANIAATTAAQVATTTPRPACSTVLRCRGGLIATRNSTGQCVCPARAVVRLRPNNSRQPVILGTPRPRQRQRPRQRPSMRPRVRPSRHNARPRMRVPRATGEPGPSQTS